MHLSPTAAVSESLTNMQLHYQANLEAISVALDTMLDAFSPERLLARFSQYQRAGRSAVQIRPGRGRCMSATTAS